MGSKKNIQHTEKTQPLLIEVHVKDYSDVRLSGQTMKCEVLLFGKGDIMKGIILTLLLCISVFLVGCAENIRLYSGPKLPKSEVAYIVSGGSPSLIYFTTLHVDGKQIIPDPNGRAVSIVEILPGTHEIEATMKFFSCVDMLPVKHEIKATKNFFTRNGFYCSASRREFTYRIRDSFDAEAGKKYVIAAALLWDEKYLTQTRHPDTVFHIGVPYVRDYTDSGDDLYMNRTLKEFDIWIEEWKMFGFGEVVVGKRPEWREIRSKEKTSIFSVPKTDIICWGR